MTRRISCRGGLRLLVPDAHETDRDASRRDAVRALDAYGTPPTPRVGRPAVRVTRLPSSDAAALVALGPGSGKADALARFEAEITDAEARDLMHEGRCAEGADCALAAQRAFAAAATATGEDRARMLERVARQIGYQLDVLRELQEASNG